MNKYNFSANKQSFSANKEGQKVWGDVLSALKLSVSASSFRTWFSGSHVMELQQRGTRRILVVGVKNNFLKEQIEKRYMDFINGHLRNSTEETEIVLVISEKNRSVSITEGPLLSGVAHSYTARHRKSDALNPNHLFSNFIVGSTNNIAHMAAVQVSENLGQSYNPLVFWGPTGVGKTHLLHAIGNEVTSKYPDSKVLYATSERFTNDYLESLAARNQMVFRAKYRSVDLLLFDDVQFFAGKESTQDEFFHTFNELVLSGKHVVIVSDRHPRELGKLKERLVSRFLGGMCADLGLPDVEMRTAIIKSKCGERGVELSQDIVDFIAARCIGGARELEGILTTALAQLRISGSLTVESLSASMSVNPQVTSTVTQGKILEVVGRYFKVRVPDMCGPSRRSSVVLARQVAMFLMRSTLNLPLVAIGASLGGRDHSTVLHSVDKVATIYQKDVAVRDDILRVKELLGS